MTLYQLDPAQDEPHINGKAKSQVAKPKVSVALLSSTELQIQSDGMRREDLE
ncbi:MAG: hypothetical protein ACPGPS_06595 [Rubripirellula sp.]|jgi:hypothetical protein